MSTLLPQTFTYSAHGVQLDVYIPSNIGSLPGFVVFHGGGMTAGSKSDMSFPTWLVEKALPKGIVVISANYRLLHPSTAQDIIDDIHDLFKYLASATSELAMLLNSKDIALDASRLAVVGNSGGNYPARVAASISTVLPRPKAWIALYGMGGDFLLDHWIQPHSDSGGLVGLVLDPKAVATLLGHDQPCSDAPFKLVPELGGYSDDENRIGLFVHFYRSGILLDYVVGVDGLSAQLRALPYEQRLAAVPEEKRKYLLPLNEDTSPAFIVHGTMDTVVPCAEGVKTWKDLQDMGVTTEYTWVEAALHGLLDPDNMPNTVAEFDGVVDNALGFAERFMK